MPLNVVGLASSSIAGGCLVIGLAHVVIGLKNRWQAAHLALAIIALSVASLTVGELLLLNARTPQQLGEIARWMHLPVLTLMASTLVFVHVYFRPGRSWLAYAAFGLGTAAVASNFLSDSALANEIHALESDEPIEQIHPWTRIGELGALLTLVFIADAVIAGWRRGGPASRKSALIVGGSLLLSGTVVAGNAMLMRRGLVDAAYLFWVFGLVSITAIGVELREEIRRRIGLDNELRRTSAALGHSRRQMDMVLDAASVGLWEWDRNRDEIWMDARAREQFGFAAGEPIDFERFLAAVHGDDRSAVHQSVLASIRDGGAFRREYRLSRQGATRWISTQGSVEAGSCGQPVLRGITLDVSGQKLADQRFRQVVEVAPTGMLIVDAGGGIVLVNAQIELDFGRSRNELVGRRLEFLIPGHSCAGLPLNILCEVTGRHRDGSQIPMSMVVTSVPSIAGGEMLVCLSNLSDRQRRDELLQRERRFLRQVLDVNPGLIFAKDRDGRFTLANRAVAEVYGTTVDALIGKTDGDFNQDSQQVENFRKADLEVLDTLQPKLILEESITDAAGRTRWLQTIKLPVLDRDGEASVVLGTSTDITERKRAELDLAHQRNELAHLSRVMMLSELSGSIAHELNQPLTAILSNAQAGLRYLSREPVDVRELCEILEDVAGDSKRAGEIIRGLRLLLKKDPTQLEPLDANLMVQDVLRLLRSDLLNAGVRCETELASDLPCVIGARVQLQQVLMNLVVNACDAMTDTPGLRLLTVSTELVGECRVQCCVRDSGPGITRERAERLFEPFFTTKPAGMGLGLPVSRKIVEAHGGQIWAVHDSNDGAAFCFTIPCQRGE